MANKIEAKIDLKTAEFLLDLPPEFAVLDVKLIDGNIILSIDTDLDIPKQVTLQYQTDEYGNIALVGLGDS